MLNIWLIKVKLPLKNLYLFGYIYSAYIIQKTDVFDKWLSKLKDQSAKARILIRIKRIENGNLGDSKDIGNKIEELRFFQGPGYRVCFTRRGNQIILLLNGGDKSTQPKDIKKAKEILKSIGDDHES